MLHRLWTRPGVRRFLWDDRILSERETEEVLRQNVRLFDEAGFGLWGMRLPGSGELAGFAGYWYFRDPPECELVFGVTPERWGQGLAPEAGEALLRIGFEELGFAAVRASTDAPNAASVRVMEKLKMSLERRAEVAGRDSLFYMLPRTRWQPADAPYDLLSL